MTRRLKVSLVVPVVLLLCFACSRPPNDSPVAGGESQTVEPRTNVGPVKAGMTMDQVIQVLGKPQRETANALEYTSLGFAVIPGPDKVVKAVMCGDVTGLNGPLVKAFKGRTKEGVGLGSTRDEIIKAYGEPTADEKSQGAREYMRYDSVGIAFSLEAGKVHHMTVVLLPAEEKARTIEVGM